MNAEGRNKIAHILPDDGSAPRAIENGATIVAICGTEFAPRVIDPPDVDVCAPCVRALIKIHKSWFDYIMSPK